MSPQMFLSTMYRKQLWVTYYKCIPKWFVANCSSMPSWESMKGVAITPALLLPEKKKKKMNHFQFTNSKLWQQTLLPLHCSGQHVVYLPLFCFLWPQIIINADLWTGAEKEVHGILTSKNWTAERITARSAKLLKLLQLGDIQAHLSYWNYASLRGLDT